MKCVIDKKGEEPLVEAVSGPSGHQESHTHVGKSLNTLCAHGCVPACACVHVQACVFTHVQGLACLDPGHTGTSTEESFTRLISLHFIVLPQITLWFHPESQG